MENTPLRSTATHHGYKKPKTDELGDRTEADPPKAILQKRTSRSIGCGAALSAAARSSLTNIYMYANLVYFAYAIAQLVVDYFPWDTNGLTHYPDEASGSPYDNPYGYINALYVGFNFVHLVNAMMYIANWIQMGYPVFSIVQVPEILNVLGACLYVSSSFYYNDADYPLVFGTGGGANATFPCQAYYLNANNVTVQDAQDCTTDAGTKVRVLELAASSIDLVAAIGWCLTWWISYERLPGRGWTFDDPDTWSNMTTLVGAFLYFTYNVRVHYFPEEYWIENSFAYSLYQYGDILYFIGSVFYVIDAFRDDGWFFFMPAAGRPGWEFVEVVDDSPARVPSRLPSATPAAPVEAAAALSDVNIPSKSAAP